MLVGVPKEIKNHEYRVGLTPEAAREYIVCGHSVIVESGAGLGITKTDDDYRAIGAEIVDTAEEIFARAEMVVKVKEPQPNEWVQLREGQILFTYLHLAPDPEQAKGLMESGVSAVAYETVTDRDGGLPLLAPMSEVAGRLSIEASAQASHKVNGGRGILMGGVPGVLPAKVVVIGGGVVGTQAARMAAGLGANVEILDRSLPRIRELDDMFQGRVTTRYSNAGTIENAITDADVVVGAVLIPGASAPKLVSRGMLGLMQHRAVLIDVAIDQGGCFETSKPTTHEDPTYLVDDIIHYCVANMPGAVPHTSSYALNNATLPFGLALANKGIAACDADPHLKPGLNVHGGRIVNEAVAESLGFS
ncbi:alanine dehydrogenase [Altererythrobacter rubellus]|uniref:Alanine dehydrogenase n=1 Tax=Altererythrobacter rubellus TaxID=2173831 RepID=A0A9Y2B9S9_9SPHN|nr:alanine dehydrogenase [Altererythrobacter rubellus]WIW95630.1 alanine dehydrogenase [Altererythrobacter rubellus]